MWIARSIKKFFLCAIAMYGLISFAHEQNKDVPWNYHTNAGYGFLSNEFGDEALAQSKVQNFCNPGERKKKSPDSKSQNKLFQSYAYEYISLNTLSGGGQKGLEIPSCLKSGKGVPKRIGLIKRLASEHKNGDIFCLEVDTKSTQCSPDIQQIENENDNLYKELLRKQQGVSMQMNNSNLVKAFLIVDHLDSMIRLYCYEGITSWVANACIDYKNTKAKMMSSYPAIFNDPAKYKKIKESIIKSMDGFYFQARQLYSKVISKDKGNSKGIFNILRKIDFANEKLVDILAKEKTKYREKISKIGSDICSKTIGEIIQTLPSVRNQILVDYTKEELNSSVQTLCVSENTLPKAQCNGLVKVFENPNNITARINKYNSSYPFGSNIDFFIKYNKPDKQFDLASYDISSELKFVLSDKLTDEERKSVRLKIKDWERISNNYFNEQYKDSCRKSIESCPGTMNFKLKFKILDKKDSIPKGAIAIHKCWNSSKQSDDCSNSRQADSANYTITSPKNTVLHEVSHKLGINDEYVANSYLTNAIGRDGSLMKRPRDKDAKLFAHHFSTVINEFHSCSDKLKSNTFLTDKYNTNVKDVKGAN